jgi:signal transduction histidine kinase
MRGIPPDSVGLETAEALACQASLVLETLSLTERTKALEAVREREMAVQNERTRLSEEMHDGLQQTMAAISLQVGSALVQIRHDPQGMQIRKPLKRAAELAEQGLKEIRDSVRDLSAGTISSTWAFVDAVSKLCTSIDTDSTRCVAKVTCELNELPASSLQNIYRVIQEAAQNVVKHAGARHMEITVRSTPDSFIFTVSDDGCGITLSPAPVGGMGFQLMNERARRVGGRLEIVKLEQGGTQVSLFVEKAQSKVQ